MEVELIRMTTVIQVRTLKFSWVIVFYNLSLITTVYLLLHIIIDSITITYLIIDTHQL